MTREPEWDADERAWMLGLAVREAVECRKCGGDLSETTDAESWRWVGDPPTVCLRCVALDAQERAYEKHTERAGMIHHVHRAARRPRATDDRG